MRILCDVHTHTLFSRHAYSTIEENVRAAAERGLELYGAADHFSRLVYPEVNGEPDIRDYQYFVNMKIWPREWHGVKLLHGCEADIVDLDGNLYGHNYMVTHSLAGDKLPNPETLQHKVMKHCDYAVASIHASDFTKGATREQITRMYVAALDHPKVLILGHVGRSGLDFDIDTVVKAARDRHKLIEVNEHSFDSGKSDERCREIARRCAELGCSIAVNTDAHISSAVGRFEKAEALLDAIDFPEELVASRSAEAFLDILHTAIG